MYNYYESIAYLIMDFNHERSIILTFLNRLFPKEITKEIYIYSQLATRHDWRTAVGLSTDQLYYLIKRIKPQYKIKLNNIINPRSFTIYDLPFEIKIGNKFCINGTKFEVINRTNTTDINIKHKIYCKNLTDGHIVDGHTHPTTIYMTNGHNVVHECFYIAIHNKSLIIKCDVCDLI